MKKMFKLLMVIVLFTGFFYGCGQDKYGQAMEVNESFIKIMRTYLDGLNDAQSGDDVADAMNKYSDEMLKLAPKMKELNEKYPDLKNDPDMPEKMKESQKELASASMEFASSFMKIMKYMADPKVAEAQQKMGSVMQSLNQK